MDFRMDVGRQRIGVETVTITMTLPDGRTHAVPVSGELIRGAMTAMVWQWSKLAGDEATMMWMDDAGMVDDAMRAWNVQPPGPVQ